MGRADSYSSIERRFLGPGRSLLKRLYLPVVRLLAAVGVSPNMVSLVGPLLGAVFVYTVRRNPALSFWVWLPSMMVDGLDGALARYLGRANSFGALVDQVADHTRETLVVVGLTAAGALSPLWGSLYPFVYTLLNVTLFLANRFDVPVPLAIKSWMVLYPAIVLYLLWGRNYLDMATMISILCMVATIVYGLWLLRRGMEEGTV